jgi:protein O-mannosyl-transferase
MRQKSTEGNDQRRSPRFAAAFVALLVLLAFFPTLRNGFVNWDDDIYVYRNPQTSDPGVTAFERAFTTIHASGNWHPLTILSHALDSAVWSMRPMGHHLTSIVLHAMNAGLVVLLICALARARILSSAREKGRPGPSLLVGIVAGLSWGLHPLRVESVAWVSERKDLLCAFFFLLGCLSYLDHAMQSEGAGCEGAAPIITRSYWRALGCGALALLCKPMAVTLPFVLLILDGYPLGRIGRISSWRLFVEKIPFLVLAGASAVVTLVAQKAGGAFRALADVPASTRCLVAARAVVLYLGKLAWPSGLLPFYAYPQNVTWASWRFALPVGVLLLLVVAAFVLARKVPSFSTALLVYLLMLVPVLGLVQVGPQAMADRYTYLPSVAWAALMGAGADWLWLRLRDRPWPRRGILIGLILAAVALGGLSMRQIAVWRDSETLWTQVIRHDPGNMEAYNNRASFFYDQNDFAKALADYDVALTLRPSVSAAHADKRRAAIFNDRAIAKIRLGRLEDAVSDESEAIRLQPARADYWVNRGNIYQRLGRMDAALLDWQRAKKLRSGNAQDKQP